MRLREGILLAMTVGLASSRADAGMIITFESAPRGIFSSYTESMVTFGAVGGDGRLLAGLTPNGTLGITDTNAVKKELRADIAGGADSVFVDLGDFAGDPDLLFLQAFDGSGESLGFTSRSVSASFVGMARLTLTAPGISYAIFGSRAPSTGGSSVSADNFGFEPSTKPVPEPSTIGLALLGGMLATLARWRGRPRGRDDGLRMT